MPKRNKIQIVQLKRSDGFVTTDRVEMRHIVADYYQSLLSADIPNVEVLKCWETCPSGWEEENEPN